jgi:GNAT superfamily N-acetyltransferase
MPREMTRNQKAVDRIVSQFEDSIGQYTGKHDVKPMLEFQRTQFGPESRQSNPDVAHWIYPGPFGNRLNYCRINGEIAGQQGELKTTLHVAGRDVQAAWAVDLRVHRDWRFRGLGVALVETLLKDNAVVLALGVSEDARKMFSRRGWFINGHIDAFQKPVTPRGLCTAGSVRQGPLKWAVGLLFSAYRFVDRAAMRLHRHKGRVVDLARFDCSIDPVLARRTRRATVSCQRSTKFLNWRFADCPFSDRYRILACRDGREITGFAVVGTAFRKDKKLAIIEELEGTPAALSQLVDFIVEASYDDDVDAVYYEGLDKKVSQMLRRKLFFARDSGHYFAVFSSDDNLDKHLADRDNWSIRLADGDAGFGACSRPGFGTASAELVPGEPEAG